MLWREISFRHHIQLVIVYKTSMVNVITMKSICPNVVLRGFVTITFSSRTWRSWLSHSLVRSPNFLLTLLGEIKPFESRMRSPRFPQLILIFFIFRLRTGCEPLSLLALLLCVGATFLFGITVCITNAKSMETNVWFNVKRRFDVLF